MSVLFRYACGAAALLALGACDPRYLHPSDLNAREIGHLSGTWSGRVPLSFSNKSSCPRVFVMTVTVKGGTVNGTLADPRTPNADPATYTSFVEYDGSMHGAVRTKGYDFTLLGTFNHEGFKGTMRAEDCGYVMSLPREGNGS
jgi:hypothetical protein